MFSSILFEADNLPHTTPNEVPMTPRSPEAHPTAEDVDHMSCASQPPRLASSRQKSMCIIGIHNVLQGRILLLLLLLHVLQILGMDSYEVQGFFLVLDSS